MSHICIKTIKSHLFLILGMLHFSSNCRTHGPLAVTTCPDGCYNLPRIGVKCNTLGDVIKRIIAEMCIALSIYTLSIYTCTCYRREIIAVPLNSFKWETIRTAILKCADFIRTSPSLVYANTFTFVPTDVMSSQCG